MWHLGTVMSAVLASVGHDVVAIDDPATVEGLRRGELPVEEPGLRELAAEQMAAGRLSYASDTALLADRELVWYAYDTPVAGDGTADVASVAGRIEATFADLPPRALAVVSSQLPVGSIAELERRARARGFTELRFACVPENLRLGRSIAYLRDVDRFVVGVRDAVDADVVKAVLAPLTGNVVLVSVESAEMIKHAVNAFLATSVAFINELAGLCELVGADARDVERGLKSDMRIGPKAYLRAGGPYAGGTLARDIGFLIDSERARGLEPRFFEGVRAANDYHATWLRRRFLSAVGDPLGKHVGILGLVYKPDTDTLRASTAVAFAKWVHASGGTVHAYDPAIATTRPEIEHVLTLKNSAADAIEGADLAIVGTEWPVFRELTAATFAGGMRARNVFDPGRFLPDAIQTDERLRYYAIGIGEKT